MRVGGDAGGGERVLVRMKRKRIGKKTQGVHACPGMELCAALEMRVGEGDRKRMLVCARYACDAHSSA